MDQIPNEQIRQNVRNRYKEIVLQSVTTNSGCCEKPVNYEDMSARIGYSDKELTIVPDGSNLGLGCGNPQTIEALKPGEVVLDLGSGGGFDCFLASRQVGKAGHIIGVDMTPEMISRARANAIKGGFTNIDFRLGEIEHLPVADQTVDVIMSNCVINLSPAKQQVFNEAFRVLRSGGRLAISDIVMTVDLPAEIKNNMDELYSACISGASSIEELKSILTGSGFIDVIVEPKDESKAFIKNWAPGMNVEQYIVSAVITGIKP